MSWRKNSKTKQENLDKLLAFLQKNKEASFANLQKELGVSNPTLTEYIKELENIEKPKIEHFDKPEKDRRHTWYRIKSKSSSLVAAQVGKYEAIQFINSLVEPIYGYDKQENVSVSFFAVKPTVKDRNKAEREMKEELLKPVLEGVKIMSNYALKGEKLVFVVTVEGQETERRGF
jgi:DNA-binding Lrp family transcriptional regulator